MKVAEYKAYLEKFYEEFRHVKQDSTPKTADYQPGGCYEDLRFTDHLLYVKVKKTDTEWILLSWTAANEPPSVMWQRGYTWHRMRIKKAGT